MMRKETWDLSLHEFVESRADQSFEWAVNDCCLFVADAVLAMTDVDLATEYRGTYTDHASAFARIREVTGGSTPEDVMVKVAADHEIQELPSVLFAQRGDVVSFEGDDGVALGIVYLNGKDAVFVSPHGLKRIAVKKCRRAWGIR